ASGGVFGAVMGSIGPSLFSTQFRVQLSTLPISVSELVVDHYRLHSLLEVAHCAHSLLALIHETNQLEFSSHC
ncbi:hypothetical protein O181_094828, partial [Austropuccinia psidii MF-1]|nr:hypothetical protein [Austropuccinia psidii MF-1]